MDDAGRVDRRQRVGRLGREARGPDGVERPVVADDRAQRAAVHELHREEALARVLAELVEPADARVRHAPRQLDLREEARPSVRRAEQPGADHLERDVLGERAVVGAIDGAHAAAAEEGADLVAAREHVPAAEARERRLAGEAGGGRRVVLGAAGGTDHGVA